MTKNLGLTRRKKTKIDPTSLLANPDQDLRLILDVLSGYPDVAIVLKKNMKTQKWKLKIWTGSGSYRRTLYDGPAGSNLAVCLDAKRVLKEKYG